MGASLTQWERSGSVRMNHPPGTQWGRAWTSRICWLVCALYLFSWLGFALASGEGAAGVRGVPEQALRALPAVPVLAAAGLQSALERFADGVCSLGIEEDDASVAQEGEAWLNSWMCGFMADFRRNFDVADRRSSNGGGHKKHAKYDAEEKAEWIRVVERLEASGDNSPIATALRFAFDFGKRASEIVAIFVIDFVWC